MLPEFLGGSADLAPSNLTMWSGSKALNVDPAGNYIHYGVREFGMTAITNGIALHGGFLPYSATFLMFVEYARNAVRMAALMKLRNVFVYTHDSIGLGEDGPTHQPVEQLASLRVTPNMSTGARATRWNRRWRGSTASSATTARPPGVLAPEPDPAAAQRRAAGERVPRRLRAERLRGHAGRHPDCHRLRSGHHGGSGGQADRGGPQGARGVDAVDGRVRQAGCGVPRVELPAAVTARVAVEAGIADYWYKYVGLNGAIVGMTTFGESAPAEQLFAEFGFTVDNVVAKAQALLK